MLNTIMEFTELNILPILLRLVLSMFIGGILGLERGLKKRPAGFRTHMLVCMGATVVMLTSEFMMERFGGSDGMRMGAQVISGIGFLGAGTIMVTGHDHISGLTTAASLWVAACVGIAVGIGFYEGAILGFVLVFSVLTFFSKIEKFLYKQAGRLDLFIVLDSVESIGEMISTAQSLGITIRKLELSGKNADDTVELSVVMNNRGKNKEHVIAQLSKNGGIRVIEES